MAEPENSTGSSFSWTGVLAILTLAGGLLLATKALRSDRPSPWLQGQTVVFGHQNLSARLWEDPFATNSDPNLAIGANSLQVLQQEIALYERGPGEVTLLPVLIHGGPYTEDHESRLRDRFAVVSALGHSGYSPEDAEHVGEFKLPWPESSDLEKWAMDRVISPTNPVTGGSEFAKYSLILPVPFEWYHSRVFNPASRPPAGKHVLVLWLDEGWFKDYPLVRLAVLLNTLTRGINADGGAPFDKVALIGPRSSDTLRGMLPAYDTTNYDEVTSNFQQSAGNFLRVLKKMEVFCPTPEAMDEVLVGPTNEFSQGSNAYPRQLLGMIFSNRWFQSFHNFSATDAQYAETALMELKRRNIDLRDQHENLVLISEWDTFYGRALELTYKAELAKFQRQATNASYNDSDFVAQYLGPNGVSPPANVHCFVYLRGLDGQTTHPRPPGDAPVPERGKIPSYTEMERADVSLNKAEGEAQFDYMTRLGDRMQDLAAQLKAEGKGTINAVGIVGSDVYDTLVILQVLRAKFPGAVFFTTDLDARFLHPQEQDWSRNLIVISSYGLQLNEHYQGSVAPFRNSFQTEMFTATCAALGESNSPLLKLGAIYPRCFEIGRTQPYDLSLFPDDNLHPVPPEYKPVDWQPLGGIVTLLIAGLLILFFCSRTLQRWTLDRRQFETESLGLQPEDLGGESGIKRIYPLLQKQVNRDPLVGWLMKSYQNPGEKLDSQLFMDFLNRQMLHQKFPSQDVEGCRYLTTYHKSIFREMSEGDTSAEDNPNGNILSRLKLQRQIMTELFGAMLKKEAKKGEDPLPQILLHAYKASLGQFQLRVWWGRGMLLGGVVFLILMILLVVTAIHDTHSPTGGEPLLFGEGISIWPAEFCRLVVVFLAVAFLGSAYASLRKGVYELIRNYRLPLIEVPCERLWRLRGTPMRKFSIDAVTIWERYQQLGRFWQRMRRTFPLFLFYFIFCLGITALSGMPYRPVRGAICNYLDLSVLMIAVVCFLFLAFWIIDAACLCRWLIEHLSQAPTRYPAACLNYFAEMRGLLKDGNLLDEDKRLLAEWIDIKLIAVLTEHVGRLVYYPFIIYSILLISRNAWWDRWSWPWGLNLIFGLNLFLALASVLILQNAAKKARVASLKNLELEVEEAEKKTNEDPKETRARVGRQLLKEVETLKQGAFAPFWQNPIIGALLIPSGGGVLVQVLIDIFS